MTDATPPDDDSLDAEGSFDNFEGKKGTLGDLWRDNALFKVGVVVAAAVAIFGAIILFGGKAEKPQQSVLPEGSSVTAPPGTEAATPNYIDAVREANEHRTEEAQQTGGSSLPTPIEPPVGRLTAPAQDQTAEDPLERWRKLQEERVTRELQRTESAPTQTAAPVDPNRQQEIQNLAGQMTAQMQSILDSRNKTKVNYKNVTPASWLEEKHRRDEEDRRQAAQAAAQAAVAANSNGTQYLDANGVLQQKPEVQTIIYPAGEIAYGQLITEANSDAQGPVLAQIEGGPLDGSRVIGKFQVTDNELLTLNFDTVVVDGISYDISAVALDPKTTLPALASDVDHHYLKKIVLPMASSFITGMANAVSQSGLTTVSIQGSTSTTATQNSPDDKQEVSAGVDKAGQALQKFVDDENARTKTTVVLKAGTPIGILFTDPVIQSNDNTRLKTHDPNANPLAGTTTSGGALPGASSPAYPYPYGSAAGSAYGQYPGVAYPAPGAYPSYSPYAPTYGTGR